MSGFRQEAAVMPVGAAEADTNVGPLAEVVEEQR